VSSRKVLVFDVSPGTSLVRAGNQGYKGAILTAGGAAATLTVYDNGAGVASGDIKDELKAPIDANEGWIRDETEVVILNGVTVVLVGAGSKAKIHLSLDKI
jgi:hypothetical protein